MPLPLDEIEARLGHWLLLEWLKRVGWSLDDWRSMYAHGVPASWARIVAELTGGAVSLADWPRLLPEPKGLHDDRSNRIMRDMDVNTTGQPSGVKRGAARATRKHPAQKKLYEQGRTITDVARELREGRPRVSAWFAEGEANRPIPRRHAETLRQRYGIPLTAWARIAD